MRRSPIECLEARRLLTYILPAYADQIGLTTLIDPNTTFEDNFEGSSLNRDKWQVRYGPRWRKVPNGAISEMSWTGEESIVVRNGNLELIAHTDANGRNHAGYIQTGSRFKDNQPDGIVDSRLLSGYGGNFEQAFGYWEARAKFSSMPGQWSAFWVHSYGMVDVGNDTTKINRPEVYGTEYDIAEHSAVRQGRSVPHEVGTVAHANGYNNYQRSNSTYTTTASHGPSYTNPSQFHVYGMLWTSTYAKFYIDGRLVHTETDPVMVSKAPHVAILSNEIGAGGALWANSGSNFFGNVPSSGYGSLQTSTAKLTADYVRVWKLRGTSAPVYGSLSGVVFNDANSNGTRDTAESGLSGRVVYVDANYNGLLDSTERKATTNASGEYVIGELQPGSYVIRQVLTSGTQTAPASVSAATVRIAAGQRALLNFGVGGLTVVRAIVEGRVIRDANNNGAFDPNEVGAANVKVYLDYNGNSARDDGEPQVVTTSTGSYRIESTRAGSFPIRLSLAGTDFVQTFPDGARWVTLNNGSAVAVAPFGVRPRVVAPVYAIIAGTVYTDINRNGRRNADEPGRSGVFVYLDLNGNAVRDTSEPFRTTSSSGSYRFEQVAPGSVLVRVVRPSRLTLSQPTGDGAYRITAVAGGEYGDRNFGLYEAPLGARIAGTVYNDANRNGRRDDNEAAAANIKVYIDTNQNGRRDDSERLTLTSVSGTYVFEQVPAGSVAIRIALTSDYRQITPVNNGGIWITTVDGGNHTGQNFGVARVVSAAATNTVSGSVFGDWNRNGSRQTGENGLGGFKVYLDYNLNGKYDAGEPLSVTNAAGAYRFESVRAGNLAIRLNLNNVGWVQTFPSTSVALWSRFTSGMNLNNQNFMVRPK